MELLLPHTSAPISCNGVINPQNSNPHNSGLEVDIDSVPTAFVNISPVLKCGIADVNQMAPQVR